MEKIRLYITVEKNFASSISSDICSVYLFFVPTMHKRERQICIIIIFIHEHMIIKNSIVPSVVNFIPHQLCSESDRTDEKERKKTTKVLSMRL